MVEMLREGGARGHALQEGSRGRAQRSQENSHNHHGQDLPVGRYKSTRTQWCWCFKSRAQGTEGTDPLKI